MSSCSPTVVMYGPVPDDVVEDVLGAVRRVYSVECPGYVEIVFHPSGDEIPSGNVEVEYETGFYYEAFEDIPRIHVIASVVEVLPRSLRRAMAVHEAVHSVLHRSRDFYLAPGGPRIIVYHAAYTTVKDLEVHLWMARRGFPPELDELREYWDAVNPDCGTTESIIDEARRLTIYVALGVEPAMKCGPISERLYRVLREVADCHPRPWECRDRLVEVFKLIL